MRIRFALALLLLIGADARAQDDAIPALAQRDVSLVAEVPGFEFHSDFWLNLHDYFYGVAGGGPTDRRLEEEGVACLAALPAEERQRWDEAAAFYRDELAELHHRRHPAMRSLRFGLTALAPTYDPNPGIGTVMDRLRGAAPAYRACLWEAHDARNRARIGDIVDHLARFGPGLVESLSGLYRERWPEHVVVDLVSYSSFTGANTTSAPDGTPHTMFSSLGPDLEGFGGLELALHEASHALFGGSHGEVTRALRAATDSLGVEMPRQLWHAVSFHSSGWAVQQVAKAEGVDYEPYWFRNDVFTSHHDAVVAHWQPYLEGEATMDEAALALVRALTDS